VTSMPVCRSVCLSARVTRKLHNRSSPNFVCMLPGAVDRSSSDGVAIRYVLPFLRMTSYFHTTGPVIQEPAVLLGSHPPAPNGPEPSTTLLVDFARWSCQLDVGQLQCVVEFVAQNAARGVKSAIYECLAVIVAKMCSSWYKKPSCC